VEVTPVYASSSGHDQVLETGAFDVTLFAWFGPGAEAGGIDGLYGCGGPQNFTGYCQRLVTADLDQSDRILDRAQWARVLNRADVQLAKGVPVIPLFEVPLVAAVRSTVRNYQPGLVNLTWNAENWWLER
jgi:oligopeptide transport system substrate-binding protein